MTSLRILALSSSRTGGSGYLEKAAPMIANFLGKKPLRIAFVPFASVDSYEEYVSKVREGLLHLPHTITLVEGSTAKQAVEEADVVMVGGGNTFKLLHDLYAADLVEAIKAKVQNGTPYIGWSAGSNLCGPTIRTTNDMPIIEPESFASFGFFPFQINPHYHNVVAENFHGETRDQRLEEFLKLNPSEKIVALPEGTALRREGDALTLLGEAQAVLMTREDGQTIHYVLQPGSDQSRLLR